MSENFREESDLLGKFFIPKENLYGVHTQRALSNFPISQYRLHPKFIISYAYVKLACLEVNAELDFWKEHPEKPNAIRKACEEIIAGQHHDSICVDALQGGAGTSTNMNFNEVIANRALQILGHSPGDYHIISPLNDINLHQSTNDTFPTALKLAAILSLEKLEESIVELQISFQNAEKKFSDVVKVGRTELQGAVLVTLGREMGAYAEALGRDRWRIYKCQERLRVVNLGGTAVGTGIGAPRAYIFRVVEKLRELTHTNLSRAENLFEATQNFDAFVEVSGILKTCASNLLKISSDLRLMSSDEETGFGEIFLPAIQAGSSIMPGKINPVIPEAVTQISLLIFGYDSVITHACGLGNLELNPFSPLVAFCLLEIITLLTNAAAILNTKCIQNIKPNHSKCRKSVDSTTALITALLPKLNYETCCHIVALTKSEHKSIREIVVQHQYLTEEEFDLLISPEQICKLGFTETATIEEIK